MADMDQYTARAFDILTADRTREAFDLDQEPESVRASYPTGIEYTPYSRPSTWNASNLLLARRLVERGVRVVTTWLSSTSMSESSEPWMGCFPCSIGASMPW